VLFEVIIMMKRAIAILMAIMLCMTFIACSNQPVTQPTLESGETVISELVSATSGKEDDSDGNDTVHSEKPTENSTPSTTTVTEDVVTSEKEKDETKPSATNPSTEDSEQNDPPKETEESSPPKVTTTDPVEETDATTVPETEKKTEPSEETKPQPQPEETKPVEQPSTYDIERLVAQYINQYRADQGSSSATILPGLTEVARYRARQLVSDFSHNSNPNPCTVLQYGEYIDMTLFGGDASESYYRGYNREAIGKGDWFGTADQMAQRIASGFKKSSKHWAYVGDSEYSYMAVGVHYNESDGKWYCCICMSSKNYGD
jgi:uncharacterized protein YkwD